MKLLNNNNTYDKTLDLDLDLDLELVNTNITVKPNMESCKACLVVADVCEPINIIPTSLLSLSNHLLVYIFDMVLEPLQFKGFSGRAKSPANYCYIDSFHNVNNILIRYGMVCKRLSSSIIPKLTRHLQLFIQSGHDLLRMIKLAEHGLYSSKNNTANSVIQFGHIEISRYSKTSQHGAMAVMGVDLPVVTNHAALRSVQSLTVESLLSTPRFLMSLMSNSSLTRLSLSTGQFTASDLQRLIAVISGVSGSLSSLKLFHPMFSNTGNSVSAASQSIPRIDFVDMLAKHYEDTPKSYHNLLSLSLTGYSRDSVIRLLSLPSLSLAKLKLYGLSQLYNDGLSLAISKITTLQSLSCCGIKLDTAAQPLSAFHRRLPLSLSRLTKLHISNLYSPMDNNPLPIQFASLSHLIIRDITLPAPDIILLFTSLHNKPIELLHLESINYLSDAAVEQLARFVAGSKHLASLTIDSLGATGLLGDLAAALKSNCTLRHLTFRSYFKIRTKIAEDISRNIEVFLLSCHTLQTFNFFKIHFPSYVVKALLGHRRLRIAHIGRVREPLQYVQLLAANQTLHTLKCTQLDGSNQDILELLQSQSKLPTKTLQSLTVSIVISCSKLMKFLVDMIFNCNNNSCNYITNLSLKIDPYCQDESLYQLLSMLKIKDYDQLQLPEQSHQSSQHNNIIQLETLTIERISSLKQPKCYQMIHSHLEKQMQQQNQFVYVYSHHQQQQIIAQQNHVLEELTLLQEQELSSEPGSSKQKEEFLHIYLQHNLQSGWDLTKLG